METSNMFGEIEENCRQKTGDDDMETKNNVFRFGEMEEIVDEVETKFRLFKNFDIIDYPPHDHHYCNYNIFDLMKRNKTKESSSSSLGRGGRIKQELSVLEENTPSWIFIRSYRYRIDLMRAAIIGPPNTPYHHCLFFFDIKFPQNYPSKPPKIHYQSYGIDLNPNLPMNGRITLVALPETRYNRLKQKLDPEESTLLHVFHAIRNMILTKLELPKPESPDKYTRRVFVLTCQKMMKIMKEPPSDFQDFVAGYFRKTAHSVLLKFRENKYDEYELMIDLFVKMFKVFERNGAYCKHHICFLRSIKRQTRIIDVEAKIRDLEGLQIDTEKEPQNVIFDSVSLHNRRRCNLDYC